jgi:N-acetylmuramoyl-L-alanine amidase
MRIRAIILTMAALLVAGAAQAGQAVVAAGAALRAGPDPLYEAVRRVPAGTRVETVEGAIGWTMVRLPGGGLGWLRNHQLMSPGAWNAAQARARAKPKVVAAAPRPPAIEEIKRYPSVVWPESGRLNLRAGPGKAHPVLRPMEQGDWVAVMARAGDWVKVEHESGAEGWAHAAYLTR